MADQKTPDTTPEEGDVKVPIDDNGQVEATADDLEAQIPGFSDMTPEEQAQVKAAYAKADEKAEAELKLDADKLRQERDELQRQLDAVADEVEAAKKAASESKDRLVRLQADWQNYRQRTAQERLDEKARAAEGLVKGLLPVLDDMERALEHATQTAGDNEQLAQFADGVSQVHDKLLDILTKEGVEVIDPAGEAFDPMEHAAVGRAENKEVYDETVDQVYQKGYRMGGKVIRSAMVTVTFGGPKRPAPQDAESKDAKSDPDGAAPDATEADGGGNAQ